MAVLDFYGMFDYAQGDDDTYKYTSAEFSELIAGVTGTGISANTLDEFLTTASGLSLTVRPGVCFIHGRYGTNRTAKGLVLSSTSSTQSRYDYVILELDVSNRKIELKVLKGTAASSSPALPALTQNDIIYQMPLNLCLVSGTSVTLTDKRVMTYSVSQIQTELANRSLVGHKHSASEITSGILSASRGGTGESSIPNSANAFLNSLSTGSSVPNDDDYVIAQYTNGGTTTTTFHRKKISLFWNYVKSKADTVYAALSHTHPLSQVTGISLSSSNPKMNGTAASGSSTAVARYDHVHPTDTSRAASSHTHDDRYYTENEVDTKIGNVFHSDKTTDADLNNYKTAGYYTIWKSGGGLAHSPYTGGSGCHSLIVMTYSTYGMQLCFCYGSSGGNCEVYARAFFDGQFQNWTKLSN